MTGNRTLDRLRPLGKPVDWESLHHRLDASAEALRRHVEATEEETAKVLRERARRLAKPVEIACDEYFEVLEFQLGSENYGVELKYATGVYFLQDLMAVPLGPAFVVGAINLHGKVVAVLDLRQLLGLPASAVSDLNRVVALHSDDVEVGLLTDNIYGVRRVPRSEIQPGLPTLTGASAAYLEGISKDRMIMLNAKQMLSDPTLSVEGEF